MSPTRRLIMLGALVATAATLYTVSARRDARSSELTGGVRLCVDQQGGVARDCDRRQAGRTFTALAGAAPATTLIAPAGTGEVTFTSIEALRANDPLLCDLHTRVGVVDESVPAWIGWTEPLVAPAS